VSDDTTPPNKAEEDANDELGREAFFAGRYREAFAHRHSAMLSKAVRWFREEGVIFQRQPGRQDVSLTSRATEASLGRVLINR
jgi:hypothetical protein